MKTTSFILALVLSTLLGKAQNAPQVSYFPLQNVKLLDSPFLQAQQTDLHYILALDPDRLLAPFLREAGLQPKAPSYTNWENTGLDGHIGGHYLSALSDTLATLFNPIVGTILSWPREVEPRNWPHNTIMDNMINLEMLFWAAKNGGNPYLYDIAVSHADKTMKCQFRPDYTSYHVAVYDTITGNLIKGVTHQGYADSTMWARGQAWAIYGYTVVYRETKDPKYLDFAQKVTDVYLERLPEDKVPYWDFSAPGIPDAPRDASAAAVVASALLELSTYLPNGTGKRYKDAAIEMLASLNSDSYQSGKSKPSFLLHSVGHWPAHSEIDASIIYADYYYIEALLRLKRLQEGHGVLG